MAKKEPVPIRFPPDPELGKRFADALKIAAQFPGVEESRSYGTPAIKVKNKLIARLRSEAEGGLAIVCPFEDRDVLLEVAPDTFYITDHYADYEFVLVNLHNVNPDQLQQLIEVAWRRVASNKLQNEYDKGA